MPGQKQINAISHKRQVVQKDIFRVILPLRVRNKIVKNCYLYSTFSVWIIWPLFHTLWSLKRLVGDCYSFYVKMRFDLLGITAQQILCSSHHCVTKPFSGNVKAEDFLYASNVVSGFETLLSSNKVALSAPLAHSPLWGSVVLTSPWNTHSLSSSVGWKNWV